MYLTFTVESDSRFRLGKFKGLNNTNLAIVRFLIRHSRHTNAEISRLVNVPEAFVQKVLKKLNDEVDNYPQPVQLPVYLKYKKRYLTACL